jgi:hypothetical protein
MKRIASFTLTLAILLVVASGCKKKKYDNANIMLLHAAPDIEKVDFYMQDKLQKSAIDYGTGSGYIYIKKSEDAEYSGEIKDNTTQGLLATIDNPSLEKDSNYTVILYGSASNVTKDIIKDNFYTPAAGKSLIRFMHLSPDAPAMDFFLNMDAIATNKVYYGSNILNGITGFIEVNSGTYNIIARLNGTTVNAATISPFTLESGKVYTVFLKGYISVFSGPKVISMTIGANN